MNDDLWLHVACFLDGGPLLTLAMLCKTTHRLVEAHVNFEKLYRAKLGYADRIIGTMARESDGPALSGHTHPFMCPCGAGIGVYAWNKHKIRTRRKRATRLSVTPYIRETLLFMSSVGAETRYHRRTCCHFPENGLTDGEPLFEERCEVCNRGASVYGFRVESLDAAAYAVVCVDCARGCQFF